MDVWWILDNVLHVSSCTLAQLKACRTVLDTTVSLPPHSECVVKVAELQSGEAKWEMPEPHRLDTTSALQGVVIGRMWVDSHKPNAVIRHMDITRQGHKVSVPLCRKKVMETEPCRSQRHRQHPNRYGQHL